MNSTGTRKHILQLILACLFCSPRAAHADAFDSIEYMYTEIGCKPVYGKDSNARPVAYDCENVFTRPKDKCYFNGNVYEPLANLSQADSALNRCVSKCSCDPDSYDNITGTQFSCTHHSCPLFNTQPAYPCYYQYNKDFCCQTDVYCPKNLKALVHSCNYNGNIYAKGSLIDIGDFKYCVCSELFNGTFNEQSCKKIYCNFESVYIEYILMRSAPIFLENEDWCPIEWYHTIFNNATAVPASASDGPVCMYGNLSFPLGQNVTIQGYESDPEDTNNTSIICSCSMPPLVTCVQIEHH